MSSEPASRRRVFPPPQSVVYPRSLGLLDFSARRDGLVCLLKIRDWLRLLADDLTPVGRRWEKASFVSLLRQRPGADVSPRPRGPTRLHYLTQSFGLGDVKSPAVCFCFSHGAAGSVGFVRPRQPFVPFTDFRSTSSDVTVALEPTRPQALHDFSPPPPSPIILSLFHAGWNKAFSTSCVVRLEVLEAGYLDQQADRTLGFPT